LFRILQATKHILVPKANSEWIKVNLIKQFEFQIQIGEIPIFELGQIRISKITFDFS